MDWIQYLHSYNELSKLGFVEPLTHLCGEKYIIGHEEGEPILICYACNGKTYPGSAWMEEIIQSVDEHTS